MLRKNKKSRGRFFGLFRTQSKIPKINNDPGRIFNKKNVTYINLPDEIFDDSNNAEKLNLKKVDDNGPKPISSLKKVEENETSTLKKVDDKVPKPISKSNKTKKSSLEPVDGLTPIGVKVNDEKENPPSFIENFKNKHKYKIKKMEILAGRYNIKKPVILHNDAILKAVIYSAVVKKTQGNIEIMGWLIGTQKDDTINIIDAYVGDCRSNSGYTELDVLETIRIKKAAKERGMIIVGQWHFHPSFSTTPSGIDDDFMFNIERMGIKTPVQLIVNMEDFSLTIMENGIRRKADFMIPPKTDNKLDIKLDFINGEYHCTDTYFKGDINSTLCEVENNIYEDIISDNSLTAFCGYAGNIILFMLDYIIPFANFEQFVCLNIEATPQSTLKPVEPPKSSLEKVKDNKSDKNGKKN